MRRARIQRSLMRASYYNLISVDVWGEPMGRREQRKGRNTGGRPWIFTILIIVSAWDHSRFLLLRIHLPNRTVFISHDGSRVGVVIGDHAGPTVFDRVCEGKSIRTDDSFGPELSFQRYLQMILMTRLRIFKQICV